MDEYLIWSHEHGGWWAPGRMGYVEKAEDAGRYTYGEVCHIVVPHIPPGEEVAVLAHRAEDLNKSTIWGIEHTAKFSGEIKE